jgi:HSP20 family protein
MNLVKFNSFVPGNSIFDEMFDEFFSADKAPGQSWARYQEPLVNILEDKEAFVIELAIPGVEKNEVEIKVDKDQLIIQGKAGVMDEESEIKYMKKEFYFGSFEKSFHIPESVERENINAGFKDGILRIELMKKEEAIDKGPKHIEIK